MIDEKYKKAYKEVIEFLKYVKYEDLVKIPTIRIIIWKANMLNDYDFKIDTNKPLSEQNFSEEAKAIITHIYENYWATDEEKKKIEARKQYYLDQIEIRNREKYNPDNLFKNKKNIDNNNEEKDKEKNEETKEMVKYKENSWIKRILASIKAKIIRK